MTDAVPAARDPNGHPPAGPAIFPSGGTGQRCRVYRRSTIGPTHRLRVSKT